MHTRKELAALSKQFRQLHIRVVMPVPVALREEYACGLNAFEFGLECRVVQYFEAWGHSRGSLSHRSPTQSACQRRRPIFVNWFTASAPRTLRAIDPGAISAATTASLSAS